MVWFCQLMMTIAWYAYQLPFPNNGARLRQWIADKLPYWADTFAPRGFFAPAPIHFPEFGQWPVDKFDDSLWNKGDGSFWARLFTPLTLLPIVSPAMVEGTVVAVETRKPTDTWHHETFYVKPRDPLILNTYSGATGYAGTVKVELPLGSKLPQVGVATRCFGDYCVSMIWGFMVLSMSSAKWSTT